MYIKADRSCALVEEVRYHDTSQYHTQSIQLKQVAGVQLVGMTVNHGLTIT